MSMCEKERWRKTEIGWRERFRDERGREEGRNKDLWNGAFKKSCIIKTSP